MEQEQTASVSAEPAKLTRSESSRRTMARRWSGRDEYWRDLICRQQASGQSIEAFCAAEGVDKSGFYAWRRKLGLIPAAKKSCRARRSDFVELAVGGSSGTSGVVVELGGSVRLVLDRGFDEEVLKRVLGLLVSRSG